MNEWIAINASEINQEEVTQIRGVRVKVSFSPYDVPRMVRGYKEERTDFFVIEFKYLTEENFKTVIQHDPPVELSVGENSGRIYQIKVNVVKLQCDAVGLEIAFEKAINRLSEQAPFNRLSERYKMAQKIISSKKNELFSMAAN